VSALTRQRAITRTLPPCLFVPHTIKPWRSRDGALAGEVLATVGVCTLDALLLAGGGGCGDAASSAASSPPAPVLDEVSAAYVTASAALALEHLHFLGVVYRGLCTSSVLVTEAGLLQLADFRFAKVLQGRAFTMCGVPEYLAPEEVQGTGHTDAVDWWSLGVLLYHLLTGSTPFASPGDDELRIYRRIVKGAPANHAWPDSLSAHAADLIGKLLQTDPAQRLGVVCVVCVCCCCCLCDAVVVFFRVSVGGGVFVVVFVCLCFHMCLRCCCCCPSSP
jgi:hypothetical protein